MARMNEKQKMLAIGGSALGACLLAGGGVWWAQGLIEEVQGKIEQHRTAIAAADQKIAKIPTAERSVIILRENLDNYVQILPESKDLITFTRTLNQFARQSGIAVTSFTPREHKSGKATDKFTRSDYQYELTATLWQFLKFLNFVENYERFVSITDVSLGSGAGGNKKGEETREGDAVHTIKLTMETYTYNGKNAGQDVEIPEYDKKKEELREEIFKRTSPVTIEKWDHRGSQGRRDIFVDPRERLSDDGRGGPSQAEQKELVEKYVGIVARLRDDVARMRNAQTTVFEQFTIERDVKSSLEQLAAALDEDGQRIVFAPLKSRWSREVVEPLKDIGEAVRTGTRSASPDPYLAEADLATLIGEMERDLDAGNLDDARQRYEAVASKAGVPETDPRHELAVRAKTLHLKATTAIEFQQLDLKVTGVLVNQDGRSGLLLNGEVFEEGEYVSDDLLVQKVEEESVRFVFRGLTLVRTL